MGGPVEHRQVIVSREMLGSVGCGAASPITHGAVDSTMKPVVR
jgi:hypothetical protein